MVVRLSNKEYEARLASGEHVDVVEMPNDVYAKQQIKYHKQQVKYWKRRLKEDW